MAADDGSPAGAVDGRGTGPSLAGAARGVTEAARALADLVFPVCCGGCGRAGVRWCQRCAAALARAEPRPWWPSPCPPGYPPTVTSLRYEGPVPPAVHAWKDGGRRDLAAVLAPALVPSLAAALRAAAGDTGEGDGVLLVPAPSARRTARRRGERPLPRLLRLALRACPEPVPARTRAREALRLLRPVRDQAGLTAAERHQNLGGAVGLRPGEERRVRGAAVVVVDDVVTTGATLVACAQALRGAGAVSVRAATLAATPLRGGRGTGVVRAAVAGNR